MSDTTTLAVNTPTTIKASFAGARLSWWPVLLFLPGRLVFAFLAQGIAAAVLALRGVPAAWQAAAGWWPVSSTLTDLFCLLALVGLTRREGIGLADLFGVRGRVALKQLAWSPLYLLAIAPAAALSHLVTLYFYGDALPPMFSVVRLPLAAGIYSVAVWPVIWVIAEELVYLGYLFPRLEALSGRTWLAMLAVTIFWGVQHIAIPFIGDGTYLAWRAISATISAAGVTAVYLLGRRRLMPIIGAHYIFDLLTGFMVGLLPLLGG